LAEQLTTRTHDKQLTTRGMRARAYTYRYSPAGPGACCYV